MTTWMLVAAITLATGAVLSASRDPLWKRLAFLFIYIDVFAAVFFVSVEADVPGWVPLAVAAALAGAAFRSGRGWGTVTVLLLMGLLVAFFSGSRGSAGPMSGWLFGLGWLSPEFVEGVVIAFRKTVHVVFYGMLALVAYGCTHSLEYADSTALWRYADRSGSAVESAHSNRIQSAVEPAHSKGVLAAAGAWALAHALFDESRQMATPGRSGSWWDVLLDAVAIALALIWVAWRARRSGRGVPN